ncbi:hypothetical protein NIIDNTM18_14180 [Mycolicibacterium litorale]|uniref:Uncharacterized protein n=1 Tax=Mycolicibacterium litorale TaxID=758802 RepID=A0A6S6P642_9MYCO|nr:hypothetical protein [Mycolicibacterium litorale]BCI52140.1 hypothetical protein NIIDNTM18_14180 [Mycolicibacterium litorale]
MTMHDILVMDIRGDVDQSGLERLRTTLDLKKFGRLTDDWDQQFGYRRIARRGERYAKIVLFREFDGSWQLQVIGTEGIEFTPDERATLEADLMSGIRAAGYQATVRNGPVSG